MENTLSPAVSPVERSSRYWRGAFAIDGSATPYVLRSLLYVGLFAILICLLAPIIERYTGKRIAITVAPYEVAGALLSVLVALRTNAGYERWWEARKLWGGIVNQSRNLAMAALAYGPTSSPWADSYWRWVAAYPHVCRRSLRGERMLPEVAALLGEEEAGRIAEAQHMPGYVAFRLARLLREALDTGEIDPRAFQRAEDERARLIDYIGGCERILKTPLPLAYSIKIRQFIITFLLLLPFALLHKVNSPYLVPPITMFLAYPLLSLDRIGVELQNPFSTRNLNHLPLDDICKTIEGNVAALFKESQRLSAAGSGANRP